MGNNSSWQENIAAMAASLMGLPTALGQATKANSMSVTLASDQGNVPISLTVGGSALSITNPMFTTDAIRAYSLLGQAFVATSDKQASSAAQNGGVYLFNNSTAKTALIYGIRIYNSASSAQPQLRVITSAPGGYNAITPVNHLLGSSTTSLMSSGYNANAGTISGTAIDTLNSSTNTTLEFCANSKIYILPANSAQGLLVWWAEGGIGSFGVSFEYLEY